MKRKSWFWGLFLIFSAAFVLMGSVGMFGEIGLFSIIASVVLAAMLIHSSIKRNFFGILISLALFYMIYAKPLGWVSVSPWLLLLASVLAASGLSLLFRGRSKDCFFPHGGPACAAHKGFTGQPGSSAGGGRFEQEGEDDDCPHVKVSFGASARYLHSDCLRGGEFSVSFGSLEVYFDQAQLSPGGAEINLDCSFGAIKLYVPRHWRVRDNLSATLGGVSNDRYGAQPAPDAPALTLSGSVQFAGVEIQYI